MCDFSKLLSGFHTDLMAMLSFYRIKIFAVKRK